MTYQKKDSVARNEKKKKKKKAEVGFSWTKLLKACDIAAAEALAFRAALILATWEEWENIIVDGDAVVVVDAILNADDCPGWSTAPIVADIKKLNFGFAKCFFL